MIELERALGLNDMSVDGSVVGFMLCPTDPRRKCERVVHVWRHEHRSRRPSSRLSGGNARVPDTGTGVVYDTAVGLPRRRFLDERRRIVAATVLDPRKPVLQPIVLPALIFSMGRTSSRLLNFLNRVVGKLYTGNGVRRDATLSRRVKEHENSGVLGWAKPDRPVGKLDTLGCSRHRC